MISFKDAVKLGFKKSFDFSGRATRAEYWWWILFTQLLMFLVSTPFFLLSGCESDATEIPMMIVFFIIFIPTLALLVRRFHDSNHTAFSLLWFMLPGIAAPIILILTLLPSKPDNEYGPKPEQ